eukprot:s1792_g2.t1
MSTRIQECYIEGQRCLLARSFLPVGETYSSHYLAYERRQPAAADMLYLDALVVEDSRRSGHSGLRKNHQFACSELGVPAVVGIGCSKEHWPRLDLRLYTTGCVTAQWRAWALNKKIQETDISPLAYRCIRAVGGNWRERLELSEAPRAALGPILPDQVLSFLSDTAWDAATCRHGLCGYGAAQTFHVVLLKPAGGLTGAPQQVSRCPVVAPALFYSETWEIGRGSEPVQGHLQLKPLLSRLTVSTTANDEKLGRSSVRSQTGTNISGNLLVLRSSIEDPLMVEHVPTRPPAVGDEALQHWIDRVRWHADRAVVAGLEADKAQDIAEEASRKAIEMAQGYLPDTANLHSHEARFRSGGEGEFRRESAEDAREAQAMNQSAKAAGVPSQRAQMRAEDKAAASAQPVQSSVSMPTSMLLTLPMFSGAPPKTRRLRSYRGFLMPGTSPTLCA